MDTIDSNQDDRQRLDFEFRGDGLEYFKIWIVNILLTIITLGIYSAWATVRSARYFHSNLYLDNSNFRYLAEPIAILKGRLIAVAAFLLYGFLSVQFPAAAIIFAVALFIGIPYFFNQALAFNRRMTSFNNIQFRFKGDYGAAFMVLYVWPILGVLSLGILYPYVFLQTNRYMVNNSSYGSTAFKFDASYKDYGVIFVILLGVALAGAAVLALLKILLGTAGVAVAPFLIALMYLGLIVYFIVATTNLFYLSASLAEHGFGAELQLLDLLKVLLINGFLIVITLGLYAPAAKVRLVKYMAANINMYASDSLDGFVAAEKEKVSALGEELGQMFDFGV